MNDRKQLNQQQFGQNPEGYVSSAVHRLGDDLARLPALVQPQPGWRMLDVATGGGHTAKVFASHVAQVIAGDLTFPMLQAARNHLTEVGIASARFHQLDAEALPYANGSFDLVTCRMAAHHVPNLRGFVQEAARVTRPGGIVLIIDEIVPKNRKAARYINAFERLRDPGHAWAYSLPRWTGFYRDAGLDMLHTETFQLRHDFTAWAQRMRCSPETQQRLHAMLLQAPEKAVDWLAWQGTATERGSFLSHWVIMVGQKPVL